MSGLGRQKIGETDARLAREIAEPNKGFPLVDLDTPAATGDCQGRRRSDRGRDRYNTP